MQPRVPPRFLALVVLLACSLISSASAYSSFTMPLNAREKRCFFDTLKKDDRLDISYQVASGGDLEIDFWIQAPDNRLIYSVFRQPTQTYGFSADIEGKHLYCFSNQMAGHDKVVSFSVQGPDEKSVFHAKLEAQAGKDIATDPVDEEVRALWDNLRSIRDEQMYMAARERAHRNTAESTNTRVAVWSLSEAALLVAVCMWQVWYLKRFFEVKRVV